MKYSTVIGGNKAAEPARLRAMILSLFVLLLAASASAAIPQRLDFSAFGNLPVLSGGRVMPLGAYARRTLEEFSGSDGIENSSAEEWLAETLFDPAAAAEKPVFYARGAALRGVLKMDKDKRLFSAQELGVALEPTLGQAAALSKSPQEKLTSDQRELLRLHENFARYNELMRSFSLILPLGAEIPDKYRRLAGLGKGEPATYARLLKIETAISRDARSIAKKKGAAIENYSEEEKRVALLAYSLSAINAGGGDNAELKIMPAADGQWLSPWNMARHGKGSPESAAYMDFWKEMAQAFRADSAGRWNKATREALTYISHQRRDGFSLGVFRLENAYHAVKPFRIALTGYGAIVILGLAALLFHPLSSGKAIKGEGIFIWLAPAFAFGFVVCHALGIFARMVILGRPPVGTLHESVVFVSLVLAAASTALFYKTRNISNPLMGVGAAFILLLIAPYTIQNGESMETLAAVLNTNFWLSTHVVCITLGYAASIMAACLAHACLIEKAAKNSPSALLKRNRHIYAACLSALFLTALGTALGGIWADQSWGRFWGWDPKENGALLIVLWLIWLLHGRRGGKFPPLAFAAGTAFLNVIVALAWFGVNLLSVGLHSYGFTSGMAAGLATFCILETILIFTLWYMAARNEKRISS